MTPLADALVDAPVSPLVSHGAAAGLGGALVTAAFKLLPFLTSWRRQTADNLKAHVDRIAHLEARCDQFYRDGLECVQANAELRLANAELKNAVDEMRRTQALLLAKIEALEKKA